ncbi:N-acetyl sugar amidotransferase, partial [Thermodesulfobacteriota bacterium]
MDHSHTHDYQICTRCIMDTTAQEIRFDDNGVCSFCTQVETQIRPHWFPNDKGMEKLQAIIKKIKHSGQGKDYDSIMGLSGGADSSFMALQVKKLGLRPLVVHVDGGWNSQVAVNNIENIIKKLDFDLHTHVVDWEEMRDLQVAFIRSGVANVDIPQDHAFFAVLYHFAAQHKIKYVLSGSNFATESILPSSWGYDAMDSRHLKSIHKRFGEKKLKT